ncbi:MAG: hypothetical protein RIC51_05380 [Erythrobacter sp.]|uniref:hypothetical protein n=1 Tax=Erythrobacter sp. TaxID=1042 RepID=UPI0032ECB7D1
MRALFKDLLKGSGTPVIQTAGPEGETILSAANIWTSAHARRIGLREQGLLPGDVLCAGSGPFTAAIDFVACCIGGFTYLPLAPENLAALSDELRKRPIAGRAGAAFADDAGRVAHHAGRLPASLAALHEAPQAQLALLSPELAHFTGEELVRAIARLSKDLSTPVGGARLTRRGAYDDAGFVTDLLLGLYNRQTIYWRGAPRPDEVDTLAELFALEIDDLVLGPAMIEPLAEAADRLAAATRPALSRIRLHTGGAALSAGQRDFAEDLFGAVIVEPALAALVN